MSKRSDVLVRYVKSMVDKLLVQLADYDDFSETLVGSDGDEYTLWAFELFKFSLWFQSHLVV